MPVKRRNAKRLVSAEREYEIWAVLFLGGADYFGELPELGFPEGKMGVTPDEARDAWRRFGARFNAEEKRTTPCWAERELGNPEGA
jgi:hypothetical protein